MNKDSMQDQDAAAEPRPFASPPCQMHEFQQELLSQQELVALLNELAEGERAGAVGLLEMAKAFEPSPEQSLLQELARDEARFCAMLLHHVERLGGIPTRATGRFADKLAKREPFDAKLELLDKGQSVVVRQIDEALPRITDKTLCRDLQEMREVHVVNIQRSNALRDQMKL